MSQTIPDAKPSTHSVDTIDGSLSAALAGIREAAAGFEISPELLRMSEQWRNFAARFAAAIAPIQEGIQAALQSATAAMPSPEQFQKGLDRLEQTFAYLDAEAPVSSARPG